MTIRVNMNGHPGYLPAGTHRVAIKRAYEQTAKSSGNRQLVLELEAVAGEHEGKIARSWITLITASERFLAYFAKAAFPEAMDDSLAFEAHELVGRTVRIRVEWPEETEYPQVMEYYAP